MPSTVEQLSPTRVKLTIEIPFSELEPAIKKAYQEIGAQLSLPGFRKGKVPNSLIDQRYGRGAVLQEAINDALPQAYAGAVEEHKVVPLSQPDVDVTKLEDGEVVEFTAEVDVRPDFELPEMSTINVEVDANEVNDDQVTERVELLRKRFGTFTEVERAAADTDYVVMDLVAFQDGEQMEDTDAHDMTYCLGEGGMVDGLDEAVRGMKAGDTKRFTTTLVGGPKKATEAEIEVTLKKVQIQELPALDDEFAQLVSEFDTVDEMLDDIRDNLVRIARIEQANMARDLVLSNVVKATEFELPEALVTGEVEARRTAIERQLAQAGLTVEQYLAETEEEAATEEAFWADIEQRTIEALRAQIILDKLADDTEVRVNQQDLTELIMQKAMQNGTSPEEEANHMVEHNHMGEWMQEIRRGKALGDLVNSAKITDSTGNTVDLTRLQSDGNYAEDVETEGESE